VRTGRLLSEWHGLDHISVSESYLPYKEPYEYLHINSIQVLPDGNLLVSARHTWALYKLDRQTGDVIWRLGGKHSDFAVPSNAKFSWQHDARMPSANMITLFDNGSNGPIETAKYSRAMLLGVDTSAKSVTLNQALEHPPELLASAMGSVQMLPGGNVVVGWGTEPYLSEFSPTGKLLSDGRLLSGEKSYRGLLLPWRGRPEQAPDLKVDRDSATGKTMVYASWNGDTDTAYWQVHGGASKNAMRPLGIARRRAFETAISLGADADGYFAVTAMDETGQPLAQSGPIHFS
jgi:Arylsulfotransferase (ASST)